MDDTITFDYPVDTGYGCTSPQLPVKEVDTESEYWEYLESKD